MCMNRQIDYNRLFRALIFACPFVIIAYCFSSGISGNDFWWHIKVGEHVIETGNVPTKDVFSWYGTSVGLNWTAHEWLSDVIFYIIFRFTGSTGIFLLSIFGAGALYFLMWHEGRAYLELNMLLSGIFFSLFAVLTSLFFYGRPHIFSFFLLFFELKILYRYFDNPQYKGIWALPFIAIVWSNLHGGSSNLTYVLCLVFLVVGMFDFCYGRIEAKKLDNKAIVRLATVTIATVAGLLVNPIGYRVLVYPYTNLSDSLSMSVISEWQAPDAKLIGNLILYFLPIVLMTIGIIGENKKIRMIDLVIMLAFLLLFFRSARFIILWYIAAAFYAFRYMPELSVKPISSKIEKSAVWVLVGGLLVCVIGSGVETVNTYRDGKLISKAISDQAITAIKNDAPEKLFNDYNLGEALIYNDMPVFFDARADLYAQDNIMADGVSLMYLEQANKINDAVYVDVEGIIERYNFDAIAILKVRPLYSYIVSHPECFELVYEDLDMAYYKIIGEQNDE